MNWILLALTCLRPTSIAAARVKAPQSAATVKETEATFRNAACSNRNFISCKANWIPFAACVWIPGNIPYSLFNPLNISGGGTCVPNCRHPANNNEARCEKSFCVWTGQSCHFDHDPDHTHSRRALCDYYAGIKNRRMVDKSGNQVGFYDTRLSAKQQLFCQGMLGDGDDKQALEGRTIKDVMLASTMRCWRPRPGSRDVYWDRGAQSEMKKELEEALHDNGHESARTTYPIVMADNTVFHTTVRHTFIGVVNRVRGQQTNFCQEFDYSGAEPGKLDKYGCGFFKASFQPLQQLTKCIMRKMDVDPYRKLWSAVTSIVVDTGKGNRIKNVSADSLYDDTVKNNKFVREESERLSVNLKSMIHQMKQCPHPACVNYFGRYDRAYEIIKQVEWDSWEGLRSDEVFKLLDVRLKSTLTTPVESDPPSLTEATRHSIMTECFEVYDSREKVSDAAAFLKESLACHPLMSDYQQVPHPPRRALWPRYWPDFNVPEVLEAWKKGEGDNHGASITKEFQDVHPLYARIALAGLLPSFSRSEYPFKHLNFWYLGRDVMPSIWKTEDSDCLTLDTSHCLTFVNCWKRFLSKHVREIVRVPPALDAS